MRIRSVVGEDTTAHLWVTERLRELGMTVEHYAVEGRKAPLVLGVLEGDGDEPGVLFDAHYDTVHARPEDWSRDPWGAQVEDGVLYGRGAVDSKGTHVAMLAALEAVVACGAAAQRPDLLHVGLRRRGRLPRRDADGRPRRHRRASARSSPPRRRATTGIEIAYPGISTWKVTAVGRTAHPTEPENGINAITKMAKLVDAVDAGRLETPRGTSKWFEPRVTVQAIRTLPGGGWTIPGRCDAVSPSCRPPARRSTRSATRSTRSCARSSRRTARSASSSRCCRWAPGRLWLRPGESTPSTRASRRSSEAVAAVRGSPARCASSTAAGSTRSS